MKRFDLHTHTGCDLHAFNPAKLYLKIAQRTLDGIAVTDHNTIERAVRIHKMNKNREFEVIVGCELKTDRAELLCYYLNDEIRAREFYSAIDELRQQDAVISVAHPFTVFRNPLKFEIGKVKRYVDAIEGLNGRSLFPWLNRKAQTAAKKHNIAMTAGSDAHYPFEIGKCFTIIPDGMTLREAVKKGRTELGRR